MDEAERRQGESHAMRHREGRHDLDHVDERRTEVRNPAPPPVLPHQHRGQEQRHEEHHVIEAHPDVLHAQPDDGQKAAQPAAGGNVELLNACYSG